jgi:hypothetical protein
VSEHNEPWELIQPHIILGGNRHIIIVADPDWSIMPHLPHIVKCVNAHAKLLAACEAALPILEWADWNAMRCPELIKQCIEVISAAKGATP